MYALLILEYSKYKEKRARMEAGYLIDGKPPHVIYMEHMREKRKDSVVLDRTSEYAW